MQKPLVIAIDGPAAAGKGTLAIRLAEHFSLPHLDTGLLYRAVARRMAEEGAPLTDGALAGAYARRLTPTDLARGDLRGHEAGERASVIAVHPEVRAALVAFQQAFAAQERGAVLDGRDIGTVICPNANVKLFITASPEVRARRRTDELAAKERPVDYARILEEIKERDRRDSARAHAPLRPAHDAIVIDTSGLDREEAFAAAVAAVEGAIKG